VLRKILSTSSLTQQRGQSAAEKPPQRDGDGRPIVGLGWIKVLKPSEQSKVWASHST
jgi:hypothetical protein